ncbi:hypothetical protein EMPS_05213 [Entomortierella parvispora]|uniref:Methyltransferase domain-containing protein n=1 Tax=Entomortierella parvispora TaxID=205924 RepID=A0A9P3HA06_9FUNG|nr:hypothetical protein EMPS_05213 [Entomortierella parvispora]
MKTLEAIVTEVDHGNRVWKFVLSQWKAIVKSREQMRQCFKRQEVTVNGELAEVTRILATNDVVQLRFDVRAAHKSVYGKEKLGVRYEDEELAVVVKPSGRTMVAFGFMLPYSLQASSAHVDQEAQGIDVEELLIEDDDEAGEGADNDDEDFEIPMNISPAVGIQRVPCAIHGLEKAANGLVLVAKTVDMRLKLLKMFRSGEISRTFRVICHGAWARPTIDDQGQQQQQQQQIPSADTSNASVDDLLGAGSVIPIDSTLEDASFIQSIEVVQLSHSNEAGHLSTLEIRPSKASMGVNIRRYLMAAGHPMVGDSGNTRPLKANRNKGLMSALVKMEFLHPSKETQTVSVEMEEPGKFEQLRIREQKARLKRKADERDELRRGGLEDAGENYDRKADLPIAYMVGEKDFCGLRFKVSPATLIPRPSTETLVQAAIDYSQNLPSPIKVLDVGTGSGCLLLALLHSLPSSSSGLGVDISEEALNVAQINMALHNMTNRATFQHGDLGNLQASCNIFQEFNILVCNPPYLDSSKATRLKKTFAGTEHEPSVALFAEKGGYGAYELLANSLLLDWQKRQPAAGETTKETSCIMAKGAYVILEIGSGMGSRVREIFSFMNFERALKDNQDSERCLVFSMPVASAVVDADEKME